MQLPDQDQFTFKDVTIGGDECILITPDSIKCKWNAQNERFRSIIIRKSDHHVISHGLKKFVNFMESPDFQPWDNSWKIVGRYKFDGSCAIISKYKGEIIFRTRGTADARNLPNGYEVDELIKQYPLLFDNEHLNTEEITIICEWCTPTNIICLREFDKPTLVLLHIIKNDTGEYESQDYLDYLGKLWGVPRPQKFQYNSIAECFADVESWKGQEGIVLHSPDYQTLKKIKSEHYLSIHRIATGIRNISNVLDVFMTSPKFTSYQDFYNYVEQTIDHEVAIKIEDEMFQIVEAYNHFTQGCNIMERAINSYIGMLDTRKKQALAIKEQWDGWMVPVAFAMLDKKPIDDMMVKKSLEKILDI